MAQNEEKVGSNPQLQAVDIDSIPAQTREGKSSRVVEEFLQSGMEAAVVTDAAPTFYASLKRYIKANDLSIAVITRKNAEGGTTTFMKRLTEDDEVQDVNQDGDEEA